MENGMRAALYKLEDHFDILSRSRGWVPVRALAACASMLFAALGDALDEGQKLGSRFE